jgi:glycosyltransferase involved in cell wall biosynthesis
VDGTPEVVIDKETGLLVPPKDVEILAKAIIFMFENPEHRKEMAENGYRLFKEKFTINKMLEKYEQVYQKVIGS